MKKILFILVSILFISCGSRKVNKTNLEQKKDSVSVVSEKTEIKTNENTEIKNNSKIDKTEDEIIIEPIDNRKEIVVNGKTYKNVKIRHKKTKDNSLHTNQKKVSKNALKQQIKHNKQVVTASKVFVEKKIEKKESLIKYFYILLLILLLYLIYKYRFKIINFIIKLYI
jgi:predicted RND superfamily exporter protein